MVQVVVVPATDSRTDTKSSRKICPLLHTNTLGCPCHPLQVASMHLALVPTQDCQYDVYDVCLIVYKLPSIVCSVPLVSGQDSVEKIAISQWILLELTHCHIQSSIPHISCHLHHWYLCRPTEKDVCCTNEFIVLIRPGRQSLSSIDGMHLPPAQPWW